MTIKFNAEKYRKVIDLRLALECNDDILWNVLATNTTNLY